MKEKQIVLCSHCIVSLPVDRRQGKHLCKDCESVLSHPDRDKFFGQNNIFQQEFNSFLESLSGGRLIFAFSGGLDSTLALVRLVEECSSRNIQIFPFTVDYGFKGDVTWRNIRAVISRLGLEENFRVIDIQNKALPDSVKTAVTASEGLNTFDHYRRCCQDGRIPCGPLCNPIMDTSYAEVLKEFGEQFLVGGGEIPRLNKLGKYSIFWEKSPGLTIVRGWLGLGCKKSDSMTVFNQKQIPWTHPHTGGYDTDCLIPGAILHKLYEGCPSTTIEETSEKFEVLLPWLSNRVRWHLYSREKALKLATNIDLASPQSLLELQQLCAVQAD